MKVQYIQNRIELIKLMPKNCICAEIGVYMGNFSQIILTESNPKELYLIDCWIDTEGQFPLAMGGSDRLWNVMYEDVVERYKNDNRVKVIKDYSKNALLNLPDNFFDWSYLDACHLYEYVLEDLLLLYTKTKPNGLVLGHDMNLHSVNSAVYEVVNKGLYKILYITLEPVFYSYGLVVNKG
jgi:hypothetical protein